MSLALTCFRPKPSLQLLDNSVLPENRVHQLLCDVLTGEQTSESMPSAHTHPQANCAWTIQANKDPKEVRRQTNCWQCPCHRNHRHLRLPKFDMLFFKILQHASDSTLWTVALCALSAWVGPGPKFRLAVKWAAKWSQSESDSNIFCKLDDMAHASCNVTMLTKCLDQHGGPTAPEHLVHSHFLSQGQNNYNYLSQSLQSTVPWKSTNICIPVAPVESWSVPARWLTLDLKKIHPIERESKFKFTKLHFPSFK